MASRSNNDTIEEIDPLAKEVTDQYEAAYLAKENLGLHSDWIKYEEYYLGKQNQPVDEDDPASNTNIIQANIESMISDMVDTPTEILIKGWGKSDRAAAPMAQLAAEWIWEKNDMTVKRDLFERYRAKLGTGIWKVYFDGGKSALGMPIIEPVSPLNFYPDPKITSPELLNMADYIIHAVIRPLSYLKRQYGKPASKLKPQTTVNYNPEMFSEAEQSSFANVMASKSLVLERWTIEDDGHLRKVVVAQGVVLYDSDKDEKRKSGYYRLNRYPFVVVPCYRREGRLWGVSDIEPLIPVQDIINDLDDQIRLNARLMGNLQIIVGVMSGINPRKWTNKPGLKIPAMNVGDVNIVQPKPLPAYIENRRNQALSYETQLITGRTDAVEGRNPGSVRAASAIIALQEAGSKRVNHKRLMAEKGLEEVFSIVMDYIMEYWTEEQEIGEEIMFKGADLAKIPILNDDGVPLLDEQGQPMTKRAEFDITVNIGAGMPNNKSFIYQATIELVQYGIITPDEARLILKEILGFPLIDPYNPIGDLRMPQGQQFATQNEQNTPSPFGAQEREQLQGTMPPDQIMQLVNMLGGANQPQLQGQVQGQFPGV